MTQGLICGVWVGNLWWVRLPFPCPIPLPLPSSKTPYPSTLSLRIPFPMWVVFLRNVLSLPSRSFSQCPLTIPAGLLYLWLSPGPTVPSPRWAFSWNGGLALSNVLGREKDGKNEQQCLVPWWLLLRSHGVISLFSAGWEGDGSSPFKAHEGRVTWHCCAEVTGHTIRRELADVPMILKKHKLPV